MALRQKVASPLAWSCMRPWHSPAAAIPRIPAAALVCLALATGLAPPGARAQESRPGSEPNTDPGLRWAVEDVRRLGLVTRIHEPRPGLLQLTIGPAFSTDRVEYNLRRLYVAYSQSRWEYDGPVVFELFRGRAKIGEYTRDGLSVVTEPPAGPEFSQERLPPFTQAEGPARAPVPGDGTLSFAEALRVFFDCSGPGCDYDYLRSQIAFVNHVRDRQAAQVLVLITPRVTGGGGTEFTVNFIGQRDFEGADDSLRYLVGPAASQDRIRQGLAESLKRGLVRYVNHTPLGERIGISYMAPPRSRSAPAPARDPWNYWAFATTLNGSINGEKSFTYISLNASFSANRTTEAWKISTSVQGRYTENRIDVSRDRTVTSVSRDYGADLLAVKSVGGHWAAGVEGTATSSTFLNQRLTLRLAPALEYNFFPYSEATRREFTLQYSVGATAFDYAQETIFGKTSETLLDQKLLATLAITRPWGSIATSIEGASYLHDFSKRRGIAVSNINLHLFSGFSLSLLGSVELVRDQLYLSRQGATDEEILLRQRQLATSFRYWSSVGFSYTFGSPFANVVNPRFGGSSGGMPILR
jgi:hypothetical protein